jgi:hypothetical protein
MKKPAPSTGDVRLESGALDRTLLEAALKRRQARTQPHLDRIGTAVVGGGVGTAARVDGAVEHRLEQRPLILECGGVHVGDIVTDGIDHELVGLDPGKPNQHGLR